MNPQTRALSAPRFTHYIPHWIGVGVLVLALMYGLFRLQKDPTPTTPLDGPDRPGVNWFYMVQLPHVTSDPESQNYSFVLKERVKALQAEGFQPMLLSTILNRLREGRLLPRNTVALFFEEGYRTTLEATWPVLHELRVPAVLLTPSKPLKTGDWGYISPYRAYTLRRNGLWDVGYFDGKEPSRVTLWSSEEKPYRIGPDNNKPFWITDITESVLNRGPEINQFRRLFFNPKWSSADVVNRLKAETPIESSSRLSIRSIQGRLWGISMMPQEAPGSVFDLRANENSRTAEVTWLGTLGLQNFDVHFRADSLHGECWLVFRADSMGNNIRAGFLKDKIVIDTQIRGESKELLSIPFARPEQHLAFNIRVNRSQIAVMDTTGAVLASAQFPAPQEAPSGVIRMLMYDKFYGVALAHGVELTIHPLKEKS